MKGLLGEKVRMLILHGVRGNGRDLENVICSIEENLTLNEVEQVRGFLTWAFFDWEKRGFGHGNIDKRYAKYISSK
jgi:hypothetical protein